MPERQSRRDLGTGGSNMSTITIARKVGLFAAASLIALALVALPVAPSLDGASFHAQSAQAKAGGGGNGGGNGGGHGNSGGSGPSASSSAPGQNGSAPGQSGSAPGQSGSAPGHSGVSGLGHNENPNAHGVTASTLGNLNAVNASPMAMSKASLSSIVGRLGALVSDDEEVSLEDLAALSNKISDPLDLSEDEETALNEAKETLESKAAEVSRSDTDE
jgi:hypothetical protein